MYDGDNIINDKLPFFYLKVLKKNQNLFFWAPLGNKTINLNLSKFSQIFVFIISLKKSLQNNDKEFYEIEYN